MRLINVETMRLEDFIDEDSPPYAILSHTWGEDQEEVSFVDMQNGAFQKPGRGYSKVQGLCEQAQKDELGYAWIDTCCIDKSSSRELEEAINNMFQWYKKASICYAYLSDVPPGDDPSAETSKFSSSRWFRRGWTLQELLAPKKLTFYDQTWAFLGNKLTLSKPVSKKTGIPRPFLQGSVELDRASVAQRMSWAANRSTKRREDIAYCLLGIFQVSMRMIYGEGYKAFHRLQAEIIKKTRDDSILAWGFNPEGSFPTGSKATDTLSGGVFATSPADFANCRTIASRELDYMPEHTLEISVDYLRVHLSRFTTPTGQTYGLLNCGPKDQPRDAVGIPLGSTDPRETSKELIRPQGRPSIPLRMPESPTPPAYVYVRVGREDTAIDRRHWFYIDDSNDDLDLLDVFPRFLWDEDLAMIATPSASDETTFQRSLARFRSKDEQSQDVIVVLDFVAREPRPSARCHVMTCCRDVDLRNLYEKLDSMRKEAFGKQGASYGRLKTWVKIEEEVMDKIQPWFVVQLATVSSLPETTVDAGVELQQLDLRLQMAEILQQEGELLPEIEKLDGERQTLVTALESNRERLAVVEGEMRKLCEESEMLTSETGKGDRKLQQLATSLRKARQMQDRLSNRKTTIGGLIKEPEQEEADARPDWRLESTQETGRTNVGSSPRPCPRAPTRRSPTPLAWAAANGNQAVARLLLEDDSVDIEGRNDEGRTPLSLAAEMGHGAMVVMLLDKGADPRTKDDDGRTPLTMAVESKNEAVVRLLCDQVSPPRSSDGPIYVGPRVSTGAGETNLAGPRSPLPPRLSTDVPVFELPASPQEARTDEAARYGKYKQKERMSVWDSMSITSSNSSELRIRLSPSSSALSEGSAHDGFSFYSLTNGPKHMVPLATRYWQHLTLDAWNIYEGIYSRCRDRHGDVSYSAFCEQFRPWDKPTTETVARTWSRLLDERSVMADSRQPKGLVMATLYMLHVERFRPDARPIDDDPDGGVPPMRRQTLRAFAAWVQCRCRPDCDVWWNFANDSGLHRGGRPLACSLVRLVDRGSRLSFFGSGKRDEQLRSEMLVAWSNETQGPN